MTGVSRWLLAIVAATAALGVLYIVMMPPGLPYDEPSHWLNVQFYLERHRMPVIDEPGVTYEAQMGPVAYVVFALSAAPVWLLSHEASFYVARTCGLIELIALVVLVWRLARRVFPGAPEVALLAAAVTGLNPMLLAMSTSVQNDTLALVIAAGAIDCATARPELGIGRACVVGLLAGTALLTKITMWPVVLVLGLWMLTKHRFAATVAYGVTVILVSGWWFVRNVNHYGDPTGKAGVDDAGYLFPPLGLAPGQVARQIVTYLWIPVEYVRNTIPAPGPIEALVVLLTLAGVAGAVIAVRRIEDTGRILAAVAGVALVGWLFTVIFVQAVSFRFAYAALPAWFIAVGAIALLRVGRLASMAIVGCLLVLNAWFLVRLGSLTDPDLLNVAQAWR